MPEKSKGVHNHGSLVLVALLAVSSTAGCSAGQDAVPRAGATSSAIEPEMATSNEPEVATSDAASGSAPKEGEVRFPRFAGDKAFDINEHYYSPGWDVEAGPQGLLVKNLIVSNYRADGVRALLDVEFTDGAKILAAASCSTEPMSIGQTLELVCTSSDELPSEYEAIVMRERTS